MMPSSPRDEEGASVVLALVFLSLFGLFISTILTFTESSLLVSKQASIGADSVYTSDGAIEGAIQHLRNDPLLGTDSKPPDCDFVLETTKVECEPQPGSGLPVGLADPAIAAFGSDQNEGIRISGSSDLVVGGDVVSNSKIVLEDPDRKLPNRKLKVYGDASATACEPPGSVVAMRGGLVDCAAAAAAYSALPRLITNPPPAPGSDGLRRVEPPAVTACLDGRRTISLDPGYYDDAVKLNALTGPDSVCKNTGKVIHFRPGLYYFDFGPNQSTPCSESGGSCEWIIDVPTGGVIGGRPIDEALPDPFQGELLTQGNCVDDGKAGNGVQFVFGGNSRLSISSGTVELCGVTTSDGRKAVVYGLPATPLRDRLASEAQNTGGPGEAIFNIQQNAKVIDGSITEAKLEGSSTRASLDLQFPPLIPQIPEGASIDDVRLRMRHEEVGDLSGVALSAVVTSTTTPPAFTEVTIPVEPHGASPEDQFDLRSLGLDTREKLNGGIKITFVATRSASAGAVAVQLDGIELAMGSTVPTAPQPLAVRPFSAVSVPENAFLPDNRVAARTIDGNVAQATLSSTTTTASVDFSFSPATSPIAVPPGAAIQSASLRVAHAEGGDPLTSLELKVQVTPSGGPALAERALPPDNATLAEDQIDLKALGLDTPEKINGGMAVRFTATWLGGGKVTESLDGMELAVTYNLLATSVTERGFLPSDGVAAKDIDSKLSQATLNVLRPSASATFDFPTLAAPGAIPPGATINAALLRVAHSENLPLGVLDLNVVVTPDVGTNVPPGSQKLLPDNPSVAEDTVDLVALGLDTPAELNARMTVAFNAVYQGLGDATVSLDGIELAIFFTPPAALRPPGSDSCLLRTVGQPGTCPLLRVASGARFVVHGRVYAPAAAVELALQDDLVLLKEGISSRTLRVAVSGSQALPPGEESCSLEGGQSRAPRVVTLSTTSPVEIQATVQFDDEACDAGPVTVLDWGVGRGP